MLTFIQNKKPLLLVNASILSFFNSKDLYGFDKSIRAIKQLKQQYTDIGLILALAHIGNYNYFQQLKKLVTELELTNNIFFLTGQKKLWPLFERIDIFLRPTMCDGTSISVSEALYLKTTIVASNVCKRPSNVIVFDIDNKNDFIEKIRDNLLILARSRSTNS